MNKNEQTLLFFCLSPNVSAPRRNTSRLCSIQGQCAGARCFCCRRQRPWPRNSSCRTLFQRSDRLGFEGAESMDMSCNAMGNRPEARRNSTSKHLTGMLLLWNDSLRPGWPWMPWTMKAWALERLKLFTKNYETVFCSVPLWFYKTWVEKSEAGRLMTWPKRQGIGRSWVWWSRCPGDFCDGMFGWESCAFCVRRTNTIQKLANIWLRYVWSEGIQRHETLTEIYWEVWHVFLIVFVWHHSEIRQMCHVLSALLWALSVWPCGVSKVIISGCNMMQTGVVAAQVFVVLLSGRSCHCNFAADFKLKEILL